MVYYADVDPDHKTETQIIIRRISYRLILAFGFISWWAMYWMTCFNMSFNGRIERLKTVVLYLENIRIMYDCYFDYDYESQEQIQNRFMSGNKMTMIIIRLIEDKNFDV